ncbi:MAG: MFS transporter [Dehalococcoidales bacterium]|nr:MFS transporter [Dehalococcoidales bacterium]
MKQLYYGWVMVILAFIGLAVIGIQNYSFGIFMKPVAEELHVTRAALSLALTLQGILGGILNIYAGRLTDKYGPRFLVTVCGILVATGYFLMSQVHALWQVYVINMLPVAIGNAGGYLPIVSNLSRWFGPRIRGQAVGISVTGFAVGGTFGPILLQGLISSLGWRSAYIVLASIFLAVLVIVSQFMKHSPERMGLKLQGEEKSSIVKLYYSTADGMSLLQAAKTARFWVFSIITIMFAASYWAMAQHFAPYATDIGIPAMVAASLVSVIAVGAIIGKLFWGFVVGKTGVKKTVCICFIILTLPQLLLIFAAGTWTLYLFSAIFGFAYGGLMTMANLAPGEFFGVKSVGTILGIFIYCSTIGSVIGPPVFGYIFDVTGSYYLAFLINLALSVAAFFLSLLLLRSKERIT